MDLRARILASMKQAMKEKDTERLSTVRLISAAIKDRDIAARAEGNDVGVDET
ncbi:MAG TPA: glutamyl-tRNA amidotransferase, partial [Rhodobacteraceae bacterium]|nr:glutamyl-tRNA amidotransferase [Paracoccaceae bacterium]